MDTDSPVGVLEDFLRSEEFETSSLKVSTVDSGTEQNTKHGCRWRRFAQLFRSKSKKSFAAFQPLSLLKPSSFGRSRSMRENTAVTPDFLVNTRPCNLKSPGKVFSFSELQIATKNFSSGECC